MSEEARWYVVHTYSGYENKVADNIEKVVENRKLQHLIHEVKVPTEIVTEVKDNKTREVERKIFPCYVLVKMVMNEVSWYVVRNTRGVTSFVGPGSKPVPLTDKEVEMMGVEKKSFVVDYQVGDTVTITDGPFADFVCTIEAINAEENKVSVIISMFGRETPIDLELNQVESLVD